MGLDIGYYSDIEEIETPNGEDFEDFCVYTHNDGFLYQLGTLKNHKYYDKTKNCIYGSFRAGSYSGYNSWREQLAKMAGYESAEYVWNDWKQNERYMKLIKMEGGGVKPMKPFYEIINFSDAEGTIGSEICKKLHKDFIDFDEKAKLIEWGEGYFYIKYKEWTEAFRVASIGNGVVNFH